MSINKRIKEIRGAIGLTQSKLAERIAISTSYLGEIENEVKAANERVIKLLTTELNINEDWLRTGAGTMFKQDVDANVAKANSLFKSLSQPFQTCAVNVLEELVKLDQQLT